LTGNKLNKSFIDAKRPVTNGGPSNQANIMASVLDRTMVEYFKKLNPSVHNSLEHSFLSHKLKMTPKRIGHQILFDSTNKIKKFSRN
jgi:hypothetical protein